MATIIAAHGLQSVMANMPGDKRLYYKKKTMVTKVTLEINSFTLHKKDCQQNISMGYSLRQHAVCPLAHIRARIYVCQQPPYGPSTIRTTWRTDCLRS
jgi:hypothetical protein